MTHKSKPLYDMAWMPMNNGRHQRDKKPYFAPAFGGMTKRESRTHFAPEDADWKRYLAEGWRIVKVRIEVIR